MSTMENDDNEGYTLVNNKRKKSKNSGECLSASVNTVTEQVQDMNIDESTGLKEQVYRLTFPKGVSPRDRAVWIADFASKHRNLSVQPRMTGKSIMITTKDKDAVKYLTEVGHPYNGNIMKLTDITTEKRQTKVILRFYPVYLPIFHAENHSSIVWARRNERRDEPKDQVIAMWEGEVPQYLNLPGVLERLKVERYVGKPIICGNCQRWGHKEWQCGSRTRCGVCAQNHDTGICMEKIRNKEQVPMKCVNCQEEHQAWSIKCVLRPITRLQRTDKEKAPTAPPPPLTETTFPPLAGMNYQRTPTTRSQPPPQLRTHGWANTVRSCEETVQETAQAPRDLTAQITGHAIPTQQQPSPPTQQTLPTPPSRHTQPVPSSVTLNTSQVTKLQKEVEALRDQVKELHVSQAALQKENQDLRILITSLKTVPEEMKSMKAILGQILQNTTHQNQQPNQQHICPPATLYTATINNDELSPHIQTADIEITETTTNTSSWKEQEKSPRQLPSVTKHHNTQEKTAIQDPTLQCQNKQDSSSPTLAEQFDAITTRLEKIGRQSNSSSFSSTGTHSDKDHATTSRNNSRKKETKLRE